MTQIPFDPEFDHLPAVRQTNDASRPSGGVTAKFAFIIGIITALVVGSLFANVILIKLIIK